ncbi:hypothetical protein XENOCAPTIV_012472, partial [Xenoophorus captivus]
LTKRVREMCTVHPDVKHTILLVGGGYERGEQQYASAAARLLSTTRDRNVDEERSETQNHPATRAFVGFAVILGSAVPMFSVLQVVSVNPAKKFVKMSDGTSERYDQLLLSTGCRCPGSDLKGVYLLQSYEDAKGIHISSLGQRAVVIGASFIGFYLDFNCSFIGS